MRLSNKYLSIKHHVKIKTINYCIIQMFLYNIIRIFTLMFSSDLVFGQPHNHINPFNQFH